MKNLNFNGKDKNLVIGMVHCLALPGTPNFCGDMKKVIDQAVGDAIILEKAGMDAIIIENMGDGAFGINLDIEQSCALAVISAIVAQNVKLPIGIDAAMNDYATALMNLTQAEKLYSTKSKGITSQEGLGTWWLVFQERIN